MFPLTETVELSNYCPVVRNAEQRERLNLVAACGSRGQRRRGPAYSLNGSCDRNGTDEVGRQSLVQKERHCFRAIVCCRKIVDVHSHICGHAAHYIDGAVKPIDHKWPVRCRRYDECTWYHFHDFLDFYRSLDYQRTSTTDRAKRNVGSAGYDACAVEQDGICGRAAQVDGAGWTGRALLACRAGCAGRSTWA